ncbi:MAG: rod shape-determining protein RodA [Omnitrophica bacterium]|nr:rod shape-determining protein RodA [Candidatus Omnitrophota bacterium]
MIKFDKILLFAVLAILIIGLFALYSASIRYYSQTIILRQVTWMLVGVAFMAVSLRLDYQKILNASYVLYAVNILLLIFVLFFGRSRGGAQRWIGIGPISIQPSEMAKITFILALSSYIGSRKNEVTKISFFLRVLCFALPVFLLILIEPDLGTALLIIPITLIMLYVAGARAGHLFGVILLGIGALPVFWQFLKEYQKQRLFVFINPNIDPLGSGYTIIQSKIAVGSGGIFGKGWLGGTQNQLNFLPERHTDFIFSVIGEEWGFIGALVLISLYALIVMRGLKIIDRTPDLSGKLMATGFIALFAIQAVINIGMTIGFLPIVGLTLPLISYGGSSLVATLITMGLLLNIGMRRSLF